MKKYIIIATAVLSMFYAASCKKQDATYAEFVKPGGYNYPAKPLSLTSTSGYNKVKLEWAIPIDPAVKSAKVYWDNYTKSQDVDYTQFTEGTASALITDLEDRSYTFGVVNFDKVQNRSLAMEITVSPYGNSWLITHAERPLVSAVLVGDDAVVTMGDPTNEMVATRFRYTDNTGKLVETTESLGIDEDTFVLPNAKKGSAVEYKSSYRPMFGIDEVWNLEWTNKGDKVAYQLSPEGWTVTATKGQIYSTNTPDKIFDGITDSNKSRYHSSTSTIKNIFPKMLVIDTKAEEGQESTFSHLNVYQHNTASSSRFIRDVEVYVGNTAFDPDDANYAANFGKPVCKTTFGRDDAMQTLKLEPGTKGRYIAIVFKNSYSNNGYIDVWEVVPFGSLASDGE